MYQLILPAFYREMAKSVASFTWERGFRESSAIPQWETDNDIDGTTLPPSKEVVTSSQHNDLGVNVLRTWPTLYDGTNNPHGIPAWWKPQKEVDVLICGGWYRLRQLYVFITDTGLQLGPVASKLLSVLLDKAFPFVSLVGQPSHYDEKKLTKHQTRLRGLS